jgi:hypothetical protein
VSYEKVRRAVLLDKTVDVNNFIVEQIEKQVSRD